MSYALLHTSGTPLSIERRVYTASIAVLTEYSGVNATSLSVSANCPMNAKFFAFSGTTLGLSEEVLGINEEVIYGSMIGIVLALSLAILMISDSSTPIW